MSDASTRGTVDDPTLGRLQVAIVDDDVWIRRGRAAALADAAGIVVVAELAPDDALARKSIEDWADVDVLLVDAHDETAGFDRFVGVKIVQQVRAICGPKRPRVVVITGHVFNDLLRVRMAEAGADFLYGHADVRSVDALVAAIRSAAVDTPLPAEPASGLNDAVQWASDHLGEDAFQRESQKALPLSRRSIITARRRIGRYLGADDAVDANAPTWREITALLDRARGKERRDDRG